MNLDSLYLVKLIFGKYFFILIQIACLVSLLFVHFLSLSV